MSTQISCSCTWFRVKDVAAFNARMNELRLAVEMRDDGLWVRVVPDECGWPTWVVDDDLVTTDVDICQELSKHLAEGEWVIIRECQVSGDSIRAFAKLVDSSGKVASSSLDDILPAVQSLCGTDGLRSESRQSVES